MIKLNSKRNKPLYEQLYLALANEIHQGTRKPGSKLPGRRTLANQLGISVHTVDHAYQLLAAEGLTISKARSGFIVQETEGLMPIQTHSFEMEEETTNPSIPFNLSTGSIDTSLFPSKTWGKIQRELLYNNPELLERGSMQGDANLRIEIANYLQEYRGVVCHPNQIIIGAGSEYVLSCLAHILRGGICAIENPGYHRSRIVLENNGIPCEYVDIDQNGLCVDALSQTNANICYITPSHHFPTGITMPAWRRAQLLQWSKEADNRYIIEDDYDSEFRFSLKALPSLQGMASASQNVIYLKTFTKSLAPGIRIACMVLPKPLLDIYQKDFAVYANTVNRFDQQTLYTFIKNGHFTRHIAKMRHIYKRRMEEFSNCLDQAFHGKLQIRQEHTGLHLLLTYPFAKSEEDLVQAALEEGIQVKGLSTYYATNIDTCPKNTVVAGFNALNPENIQDVASLLAKAWLKL